jgi:hypothetical protein
MDRRGFGVWVVVAVLLCGSDALAQAAGTLDDRVMTAVRAAMAPALPFPETDADGSMPANESPGPLWMVRPWQPGDRTIQVLANPLNLVNQERATRAMAQIHAAIEAAQRRSEAQYERAVAEAKRTGRSQEVDGVTLSDEGVAGARIDAEGQVSIDVEFNQPAYALAVESAIAPAPGAAVVPGAAVIVMPSSVFRDRTQKGSPERFSAAEMHVFFGALTAPEVKRRGETSFEVSAAETPREPAPAVRSLVLRLRGNDSLMADILRRTDWARLLELLK